MDLLRGLTNVGRGRGNVFRNVQYAFYHGLESLYENVKPLGQIAHFILRCNGKSLGKVSVSLRYVLDSADGGIDGHGNGPVDDNSQEEKYRDKDGGEDDQDLVYEGNGFCSLKICGFNGFFLRRGHFIDGFVH